MNDGVEFRMTLVCRAMYELGVSASAPADLESIALWLDMPLILVEEAIDCAIEHEMVNGRGWGLNGVYWLDDELYDYFIEEELGGGF